MNLTAIVVGAGWAGEGHTIALRAAGVEVVAMCGRTPEPARAMAAKLGILELRFDWRKALEEFKPDIVAIATPAAPHCEIALAAAELGCHLICDKPLAVNCQEAQAMLLAVQRVGVKHAYAPTSRYGPAIIYARELLSSGLIGQIQQIEAADHIDLKSWPFGWIHQLSQGGGALNNGLTHKLAQIIRLTDSQVIAVMGQTHGPFGRAYVGAPIHDFREFFRLPASAIPPENAEWREADADQGYTVLLQLRTTQGQLIGALIEWTAGAHLAANHLTLFGTQGTLSLAGPHALDGIQHFDRARQAWQNMPVPQRILDAMPQVEDPVQRDWNQLFREFVADVRGEGYAGYPTFHDGWIAAEIIDTVRSGRTWAPLPEYP